MIWQKCRKELQMIIDELKNRKILSAPAAVRYGFISLKQNIVSVMIILLIIYFPINVLRAYIAFSFAGIESRTDLANILSNTELVQDFIMSPEYMKMLIYNMSDMLVQLALVPFGSMAVIYVAKEAFEGRSAGYKEALSAAFSNGGRFFASMIVYVLCTGLLLILGIVPGIILGIIWYFYLFAVVLDDCPGISSLGRSRKLVKGRWFKTLLYIIVFLCMDYVAGYIISSLFMLASGTYFAVVMTGLLSSLFGMLITAAETAVYIFYKNNMAVK